MKTSSKTSEVSWKAQLLSQIEQLQPAQLPLVIIPEFPRDAWKAESVPHLHKGMELKLESTGWSLVAAGVVHDIAHPLFSLEFGENDASLVLHMESTTTLLLPKEEHPELSWMSDICELLLDIGAAGHAAAVRQGLTAALTSAFLLLIQHCDEALAPTPLRKYTHLILACIRKNYFNPAFGIEDLAEQLGVSTQFLNRQLHLLGQQPLRQSLVEYRLQKAKELLLQKKCPAVEVARLTGWSSQFYFNTCFTRRFGCPPHQFTHRQSVS